MFKKFLLTKLWSRDGPFERYFDTGFRIELAGLTVGGEGEHAAAGVLGAFSLAVELRGH